MISIAGIPVLISQLKGKLLNIPILLILDVLIKKIDNKFTTDISRKPAFSGQCLMFDSSVDE